MNDPEENDDIAQDIAEDESLVRELTFLFGEEIVDQARVIDSADLNMTDAMTASVGEGVRQLKQLIKDPQGQRQWVAKQSPAEQLLLCLWIMDMGLLDKIQTRSYL